MQSRQNYLTREELPIDKEFIINKFITVKLEEKKTVIYVAGKPFEQCKMLLLNISIDDVEDFDEIESIDEVAEMLNWDIDDGQEGIEYDIPPETEFFVVVEIYSLLVSFIKNPI